jgi:hypothetical protein
MCSFLLFLPTPYAIFPENQVLLARMRASGRRTEDISLASSDPFRLHSYTFLRSETEQMLQD